MFDRLRLGYLTLLGIAAFMLCVALYVGDEPLQHYFDVSNSVIRISTWLLPPVIWLSWLGILVTIQRADRPTLTIFRMLRRHRHWLLRGTLLTALVLPIARSFSAIKQAIPELVPFYADPALAYLDRIIFFGIDPWRITHAVMGPFSTLLIDRVYVLWFPVMFLMTAWFNFTRDLNFQVRGLLTYVISSVLLGNLAAMGLSSVGPCFYELYYGDLQFKPMMDTLRSDDAVYSLKAFGTMDWLYSNRDEGQFGSGISAMPSIHVAIAFLFFLAVRHKVSNRWARRSAALFFVLIWIGSVHLGWHYAIDGLFSIIGVYAVWWATGRFVDSLDRQRGSMPDSATPSDSRAPAFARVEA